MDINYILSFVLTDTTVTDNPYIDNLVDFVNGILTAVFFGSIFVFSSVDDEDPDDDLFTKFIVIRFLKTTISPRAREFLRVASFVEFLELQESFIEELFDEDDDDGDVDDEDEEEYETEDAEDEPELEERFLNRLKKVDNIDEIEMSERKEGSFDDTFVDTIDYTLSQTSIAKSIEEFYNVNFSEWANLAYKAGEWLFIISDEIDEEEISLWDYIGVEDPFAVEEPEIDEKDVDNVKSGYDYEQFDENGDLISPEEVERLYESGELIIDYPSRTSSDI